jgi:hypothetical protein
VPVPAIDEFNLASVPELTTPTDKNAEFVESELLNALKSEFVPVPFGKALIMLFPLVVLV